MKDPFFSDFLAIVEDLAFGYGRWPQGYVVCQKVRVLQQLNASRADEALCSKTRNGYNLYIRNIFRSY
jgi:hypothetical protein